MGFRNITFRKIIGLIHLWLGLSSGLVIFMVAVSGALLTFQYPIEKYLLQPTAWFVATSPNGYLPLDTLLSAANKKLNQLDDYHPANAVFLSSDSSHVIQIGYNYYDDTTSENHRAYALVNPYTAAVTFIKKGNAEHWIWEYIIDLHVNLLLGEWGNQAVKWATLIFLVQLISGLVLWWPKNKPAAKQRFWFRWTTKTKWRRQNYDLHNILGFYTGWIVVFMALTGAMWAFEWFNNGVYLVASFGKSIPVLQMEESQDSITTNIPNTASMFSQSLQVFKEKYSYEYAHHSVIFMGYFSTEKDSLLDVVAIHDPIGLRVEKSMEAMIDKTTFKVKSDNLDNYSTFAGMINSSTNELHYGTCFGLTSQILTFFACLITASLPITGFYIWLGRKKKEKKHVRGNKTI